MGFNGFEIEFKRLRRIRKTHENPQSGQCLPGVAFGVPYYTGITPWITPQTPNPFGVAAPLGGAWGAPALSSIILT